MPLTAAERKERLGRGAITKMAHKLRLSISHVSQVVRGERVDLRVMRESARRMGETVADAYGPEYEQRLSSSAA